MEAPAHQTTAATPLGRILVGCDFAPASQAAFRLALHLGARTGGVVEAVYAYQSSTRTPVTVAGPEAKEKLKGFVSSFVERGAARLQRRTEYGDAFHAILGVALRGAFDLVVVGRHGREGSWPELGSVSDKIVRSVGAAVVVVPPPPPRSPRPTSEAASREPPTRLALCLDPASDAALLDWAVPLLATVGARVEVLHATRNPGDTALLDGVTERLVAAGVQAVARVEHGDAATLLPRLLRSEGYHGVLVGRAPAPGRVIAAVLRDADLPIWLAPSQRRFVSLGG